MDLLQKYGLFIIVICNKVLSQSLLFMNSDNFQWYHCFGKKKEAAVVRSGLLGLPWTPRLVCVVMKWCILSSPLLVKWYSLLSMGCATNSLQGMKKRSCCREYGSAYTIHGGFQRGNSCWVTVSSIELASQLLLHCLCVSFLILVETI